MQSPAFRSSSPAYSGTARYPCIAAFAAALLLTLAGGAFAHDIPNDVTIQAFVKPAGTHLNLLLRVPLNAMRDTEFPERGPGYLDLERMDSSLREAASVWLADAIEVDEDNVRLPNPRTVDVRVSLQSDKSFASYDAALAHVTGPRLTNEVQVYWNQVMLDVWFEYPIHSDQSRFSIHPGLARLGLQVITVLRFIAPNEAIRAFEFVGDPGLVHLDPHWYQAALNFVTLGFFHILSGTDHLLFLFCLVIPFRSLRKLIPVVTSFTVAHSITLIASAYNLAPDFLWFPPLIETLIAISIVYMAIENIVGGIGVQRRWMITFGFGLVHGFGFSFALRQTLQFAGSHLLASLLSFNIGVELGQLLVLVLLIPLLHVFFRFAVAERTGTIILSALVAHTGWHWMIDRGERLRQFPFAWPLLTDAMLASAMRLLMVLLIVAGLLWFVAKHWPLKFPLGQPSPRNPMEMDSARVGAVGNRLESETGGKI
jgi:HupE / UreJ protein